MFQYLLLGESTATERVAGADADAAAGADTQQDVLA
jgi:hypothetical protein